MLLYAQDEVGYISHAVIAEIARRVEIPKTMCGACSATTPCCGPSRWASTTSRSAQISPACCATATAPRALQEAARHRPQGSDTRRPVFSRRGRVHWGLLLGAGHPGELRLSRRPDHGKDGPGFSKTTKPDAGKGDGVTMPRLVSHPDEVKNLSRRFGQGAATSTSTSSSTATRPCKTQSKGPGAGSSPR